MKSDNIALSNSRRGFLRKGIAGGLLFPAADLVAQSPKPSLPATSGKLGRGSFDVREFGASGNGVRLETKSLQAAIDACAASGGGTVHFPSGKYLSGTIFMKSNVTLALEAGATLLGSTNLDDYPSVRPSTVRSYTDYYVRNSLIFGEGLERIAITGLGTIDGQGMTFREPYPKRPYIIRFINCHQVEVSELHIQDSPMWVQHYLECSHVNLHNLTVRSLSNRNNDGIDLDACEKVRISNCDIIAEDDAIVLKSTTDKPCQDVTITNCVLSSRCNALKLGTESVGGFRNITISNCVIYDTDLSGIALETVDGGTLENICVSDITMRNVKSAIFLRLGDRGRPLYEGAPKRPVGAFRNVHISNVLADGADKIGCAIAGIPDHAIENVTLENIRIQYQGGGKKEDVMREIPEKLNEYPEYINFGVLPAYAFYCRHARGIRFANVRVSCLIADERPALVCDDVDRLAVSGFEADKSSPVFILRNTRHALLNGNVAPEDGKIFLRAEGMSANIRLFGNDLSTTPTPVEFGPGTKSDAVVYENPPDAK
jgi:hypothetical protein